jgi:hypothetical protein
MVTATRSVLSPHHFFHWTERNDSALRHLSAGGGFDIQALAGVDKPRPYPPSSSEKVAAGFIPARIGSLNIEVTQIRLY